LVSLCRTQQWRILLQNLFGKRRRENWKVFQKNNINMVDSEFPLLY
jgi:hypothetical protein